MPVRIVNLPKTLNRLAKGRKVDALDAELAAEWARGRIRDLEDALAACDPAHAGLRP